MGLRILQIIQKPQLRGAEIFACQLSMRLKALGHHVDIAYLFDAPNQLQFDLHFISLNANKRRRFFDFGAYKKLNDIIVSGKYQLVQANAGDTLKYASFSRMLYRWKAPLVFRNANMISDFMRGGFRLRFNKLLVSQVDYVISVSDTCRTDFIKTFNLATSKIETIEIGVDLAPIGVLPQELATTYAPGPVLINVAGLVPEKNHHGLLRIFKTIAAQKSNVRLVIVGEGRLMDSLRDLAVKFGLNDRVVFTGRRSDVLALIKAANVFLLPSHIEGLPAVILEAQYCGVPVVAYNVGGIGEVLSDGAGWLVQKDDEDGFVKQVLEVLENPQAVLERVNKARTQVMTRFNNEAIAFRFASAYRNMIKSE